MNGIYRPNQFGGEDHGWVANFAIRAELGLPITIFGSGKQLRDILFASDAAAAFEAFYRSPMPGVYNVGGGEMNAISLIESIQLIEQLLEKKADVRFEEGRFGDLRYFVTSSESFRDSSPDPLLETRMFVICSSLLSNRCKESSLNMMYGFLPPPAKPPFFKTSETMNSVLPDWV